MDERYKRIKELKKQIQKLEEEIKNIETEIHNDAMQKASFKLKDSAKLTETEAENKFYAIAKAKKLHLQRQFKINIIRKKDGYIERFYFADFCDITNKLVFEVDGGYHFTEEQRKKDNKRTSDLRRMGYRVFRISNSQVNNGKTTQFLIESYKKIGIDI